MIKKFINSSIIAVALFVPTSFSMAKTTSYTIDPYHTNVTWKVSHFGFSNPSGKFTTSKGTLKLDMENPQKSSVDIEIDATSLSTGNKTFDEHLSAESFFNLKTHKSISFKSTKIELTGKDTAKIHGQLTFLGVKKPVVLDAKLNGIGRNDYIKKDVAGFSATTSFKRSDFGMNAYIPSVADQVFIDIEVEFNK